MVIIKTIFIRNTQSHCTDTKYVTIFKSRPNDDSIQFIGFAQRPPNHTLLVSAGFNGVISHARTKKGSPHISSSSSPPFTVHAAAAVVAVAAPAGDLPKLSHTSLISRKYDEHLAFILSTPPCASLPYL